VPGKAETGTQKVNAKIRNVCSLRAKRLENVNIYILYGCGNE